LVEVGEEVLDVSEFIKCDFHSNRLGYVEHLCMDEVLLDQVGPLVVVVESLQVIHRILNVEVLLRIALVMLVVEVA